MAGAPEEATVVAVMQVGTEEVTAEVSLPLPLLRFGHRRVVVVAGARVDQDGTRVVSAADGAREVPAGIREDPDGIWEVVVVPPDGAREATVADGPTEEVRAMPSRTATTMP